MNNAIVWADNGGEVSQCTIRCDDCNELWYYRHMYRLTVQDEGKIYVAYLCPRCNARDEGEE